MNKQLISRLLLFSTLLFGLLGSVVTPVAAGTLVKAKPLIRTIITLNDLGELDLGEEFVLTGKIIDSYDRPVAEKPVLFAIDGEYLGQARSDENGNFERKFKNELNAGTYEITATSNATATFATATSSMSLKILPAEMRVQTVPAIAGVAFELDGRRFVSGADGSASIKVDEIGKHQLHVMAEEYEQPAQRLEFGRWLQESYEPFQEIQVPNDKDIQVGLNVFHLVGQSFVDPEGNPVGADRITSFTIRSIQGDVFEFTDGQPRWIPASRTARRVNGLEETKLLYSVIDVMVNGSNVVNQSQQRFYTHPNDNWEISLLFYSMRVDARDGLFGNTVGESVNLEFPDGSVKNYPLDKNGVAEIRSLPRGIYTIEFVGINGVSNRTPVALSRDQEVHSKVITHLDMAMVGLLGLILALGLLLYGRPWLLHSLLGRKKPVVQEPAWVPVPVLYEEAITLADEPFHRLTGVSKERFASLLASLQEKWGDRGKKAKLSREDQLLMTLIASKKEQSKVQLGEVYDISETTVRRTVKKVKATLAKIDESERIEWPASRYEGLVIEKIEMGTMVEAFDQDVEVVYEK